MPADARAGCATGRRRERLERHERVSCHVRKRKMRDVRWKNGDSASRPVCRLTAAVEGRGRKVIMQASVMYVRSDPVGSPNTGSTSIGGCATCVWRPFRRVLLGIRGQWLAKRLRQPIEPCSVGWRASNSGRSPALRGEVGEWRLCIEYHSRPKSPKAGEAGCGETAQQ